MQMMMRRKSTTEPLPPPGSPPAADVALTPQPLPAATIIAPPPPRQILSPVPPQAAAAAPCPCCSCGKAADDKLHRTPPSLASVAAAPRPATPHPLAAVLGAAATLVAAVGGSAGVLATYFELSRAHELEVYLSGRELTTVVRNAVGSCVSGTLAGMAFGSLGAAAFVGRAIFKPVAAAVVVHRVAAHICEWRIRLGAFVRDLESTDPAARLRALRELLDMIRRRPGIARRLNKLSVVDTVLRLITTGLPDSLDLGYAVDLLVELIKDAECRSAFLARGGADKAVALLDGGVALSLPFRAVDLRVLQLLAAAAAFPEGQEAVRKAAVSDALVGILDRGLHRLTKDDASLHHGFKRAPSGSNALANGHNDNEQNEDDSGLSLSLVPEAAAAVGPFSSLTSATPSTPTPNADTTVASIGAVVSEEARLEQEIVKQAVALVQSLALSQSCRADLVNSGAVSSLSALLQTCGTAVEDKLSVVSALHNLVRDGAAAGSTAAGEGRRGGTASTSTTAAAAAAGSAPTIHALLQMASLDSESVVAPVRSCLVKLEEVLASVHVSRGEDPSDRLIQVQIPNPQQQQAVSAGTGVSAASAAPDGFVVVKGREGA